MQQSKRESDHKKYKRGINIGNGINTALISASLGLGGAGVGLLSIVTTAPIGLPPKMKKIYTGHYYIHIEV